MEVSRIAIATLCGALAVYIAPFDILTNKNSIYKEVGRNEVLLAIALLLPLLGMAVIAVPAVAFTLWAWPKVKHLWPKSSPIPCHSHPA